MRTPPLAAALVLACAAPVRADAVPPPPDDCPRGSVGETGHGGTRCEEATCASDADCGEGRACRPVALCVREVQATFNTYSERPARETFRVAIRECGGGPSECPPDAPAHIGWRGGGRDVTDVTGDEGYRAAGPARCTTAPRCVPASEPAPPSRGQSGASAPAPSGSAPAAPGPSSAPSSGCAIARRSEAMHAALAACLAALLTLRRSRRSRQ